MTIRKVEFASHGGVTLRGRLHVPAGEGPFPAITMAHGYGGTFEHGLVPYAERFVDAGFVVLLHDHRGFGMSDGEPRQDIDPWQQIADWRRAVTYLESVPEAHPGRIGLWGTSYAGGHALVMGATDRRLRAIVSQVPTMSGFEQSRRRVAPDAVAGYELALDDDERAQLAGSAPRYQPLVSDDPATPASYRAADAIDFYLQKLPSNVRWVNESTVQSGRRSRMYEPGNWLPRVSPTPLLMVVARNDTVTLTDLALAGYATAPEPKQLQLIDGDHFAAYVERFDESSSAALNFFRAHL